MKQNGGLAAQVKVGNSNQWLNEFSKNINSQFGEDGIIEKILEIIEDNNKWCVEFGAHDGKYCSNVFNLIQNKGYSAVLIEPNTGHFNSLVATHKSNERVLPIKAFVGFESENGLDAILKTTNMPPNFDLLSIDVDGNDYHCWKSVVNYRPKIVVIEFNPTIPNAVQFVQKPDMRVSQGSSILSIRKLAKSKGYELVAVTLANAIFVDEKYFHLFSIRDNSVEVMRTDESSVTYIFSGYDGTVCLAGCGKLLWHDIRFRGSRMQQLPKWLRQYPGNYGLFKKVALHVYRYLRERNII
jgi:hypothetical protein